MHPTIINVSVAPIDIIYDQQVLLQLTSFADAAWPPAEADPLVVCSKVSLEQTVREGVLGRQLQRRRHQQHNMQVNALPGSKPL